MRATILVEYFRKHILVLCILLFFVGCIGWYFLNDKEGFREGATTDTQPSMDGPTEMTAPISMTGPTEMGYTGPPEPPGEQGPPEPPGQSMSDTTSTPGAQTYGF